jgi:hypothetical protein
VLQLRPGVERTADAVEPPQYPIRLAERHGECDPVRDLVTRGGCRNAVWAQGIALLPEALASGRMVLNQPPDVVQHERHTHTYHRRLMLGHVLPEPYVLVGRFLEAPTVRERPCDSVAGLHVLGVRQHGASDLIDARLAALYPGHPRDQFAGLLQPDDTIDFHAATEGDHGGHRSDAEGLRDFLLLIDIDLNGQRVLFEPRDHACVHPGDAIHDLARLAP